MEVEKGAIICGNASTPNLLVAEYTKAEGTFGIVPVNIHFFQAGTVRLIAVTRSRDRNATFTSSS
jgi:hypothetical protein